MREFAAQVAGARAPAMAMTRPARARIAHLRCRVDGEQRGREAGVGRVGHRREHVVVQQDAGRDRDEARDEAGDADRADDHGEGLPGGHAEGFEDADVVGALADLEGDRVQHAEAGDRDDQQGEQRDQGDHGDQRLGAAAEGVDVVAAAERALQRAGVGVGVHAGLEGDGVGAGAGDRRVDRAEGGGRHVDVDVVARPEDLADDLRRDLVRAVDQAVRVADRGVGVVEEEGVGVNLADV